MSEIKKTTIHVDSRDRDVETHPDPGHYRLFISPIHNVVGCRLSSAELPASMYIFSETLGNTTMRVRFSDADQPSAVSIPSGNYDSRTFASVLSATINEALQAKYPGRSPITVRFSKSLAKLIFVTDAPFVGRFSIVTADDPPGGQNTLAWHAGFPPGGVYSAETGPEEEGGILVAPEIARLNPHTYLLMYVDEFENTATSVDNTSSTSKVPFAKIPLNTNSFGWVYYEPALADADGLVRFNPTLPRVDRLTIRVCGRDGVPIDFQKTDHSLSIDVYHKVPSATLSSSSQIPSSSSSSAIQFLQQQMALDGMAAMLQQRTTLPPPGLPPAGSPPPSSSSSSSSSSSDATTRYWNRRNVTILVLVLAAFWAWRVLM